MAMAEVYEVATFYHHFDVVKEGDSRAAGDHRARLRFDRLRAGRLARSCSTRCPPCWAPTCACCTRRASAAARPRRSPSSARTRFRTRPPSRSSTAVKQGRVTHPRADEAHLIRTSTSSRLATSTTPRTAQPAATRWRRRASTASGTRGRRHRADGGLGAARPRRRRLPGRPQVEAGGGRAGAAPDGDQHRRGRAGHVQGPLLPGTRPAPLPRGRAHRRLGGRHRRGLHLPARRVSRLPRDPRARDRGARRRPAVPRSRRSTCAAAPAPTSAAKSRR